MSHNEVIVVVDTGMSHNEVIVVVDTGMSHNEVIVVWTLVCHTMK